MITLEDIGADDVRAAVDAHQLSLEWTGDSFMAHLWLGGEHRRVHVDGEPVGVAGWEPAEDDRGAHVSLLTLDPHARGLDREVLRLVLEESGARTAYVASWDAHHVATLGAFATGIGSQAWQFRVLDPADLHDPVEGLELRLATHEDLDYLESTGWQSDFAAYVDRSSVSVARLDGHEVGIAVHERHALVASVVDIGMYVDPVLRRRGVGRSIIAATARTVLADGGTPVAGCWWKNAPSRATLEAAGMVCAGTVFRLDLDPAAVEWAAQA